MQTSELQELVFQLLLARMHKKKRFQRQITEEEIVKVIHSSGKILENEPLMLELTDDIVIVGDLHGNVDDLLRIFERLRYPPSTRYIFLGDYVDRGVSSVEVLVLLLILKVLYPNCIYLLRGNHETQSLSKYYGFYNEVLSKYSENLYNEFIQLFYKLPLCATIGQKIFCVHGGISPRMSSINELREGEKPEEIISETLYSDLVWSDPSSSVEGFVTSDRGRGYLFGPTVLESFLDNNNLDLLVRSHEACDEGVSWPFIDNEAVVDRCLTVFSNSDYCGRENNAAVLQVTADLQVSIVTIEALLEDEIKSRRVLLPFWLSDLIKAKEIRPHPVSPKQKTSESRRSSISSVAQNNIRSTQNSVNC